ncbi:hypothetical protein SEA_CHRIS_1 [Mycobacterium phage Chris]|uniref:Gene 1 ring forming protein domain-containing protein n=1 Tax=Mycobacterium phage Chris TaxID=2725626 RepID=A0A6M3TAH8_9CAUD|nr:hypothetical protein I5G96_gp001 [Mycobacterium phage Chris]QJD50404.1 hypothetical protein SEA_CHRIS_1 [Mycobacterium phage Chris]
MCPTDPVFDPVFDPVTEPDAWTYASALRAPAVDPLAAERLRLQTRLDVLSLAVRLAEHNDEDVIPLAERMVAFVNGPRVFYAYTDGVIVTGPVGVDPRTLWR